jgi:DNA-binding response OmpR family regulator
VPGKVLIVHSEPATLEPHRQELASRGFTVEVLAEARSVLEHARHQRPALVVLAVELSGGQNGYLLCGKLKKDDALQALPIILIGNPDGFAAHRKLKTHADGYLPHPVAPTALAELVESLTRGGMAPRQPAERASGLAPPSPPSAPAAGAEQPTGSWPLWLRVALGLGVAACVGGWLAFR